MYIQYDDKSERQHAEYETRYRYCQYSYVRNAVFLIAFYQERRCQIVIRQREESSRTGCDVRIKYRALRQYGNYDKEYSKCRAPEFLHDICVAYRAGFSSPFGPLSE